MDAAQHHLGLQTATCLLLEIRGIPKEMEKSQKWCFRAGAGHRKQKAQGAPAQCSDPIYG